MMNGLPDLRKHPRGELLSGSGISYDQACTGFVNYVNGAVGSGGGVPPFR